MEELRELRSDCPINYTLEALGDRWSLLIIRDMLLLGKGHFREFLTGYEKIAPNILSARLKKLQEWGIIEKVPGPNKRSPHGFRLTEDGQALAPVLLELARWGSRFVDAESLVPPEVLKLIRENREQNLGTSGAE